MGGKVVLIRIKSLQNVMKVILQNKYSKDNIEVLNLNGWTDIKYGFNFLIDESIRRKNCYIPPIFWETQIKYFFWLYNITLIKFMIWRHPLLQLTIQIVEELDVV